jgi:nucleotidyltransferase/DNA polymerase involved in DNA repair
MNVWTWIAVFGCNTVVVLVGVLLLKRWVQRELDDLFQVLFAWGMGAHGLTLEKLRDLETRMTIIDG